MINSFHCSLKGGDGIFFFLIKKLSVLHSLLCKFSCITIHHKIILHYFDEIRPIGGTRGFIRPLPTAGESRQNLSGHKFVWGKKTCYEQQI